MFFSKIPMMKDVYKKSRIKHIFKKEAKFENSNPDSVGVNFLKKIGGTFGGFEIPKFMVFC